MDLETLERTGPSYSVEKLLTARRKTTEAVLRIAEKIRPGMLKENPGPRTHGSIRLRQRMGQTFIAVTRPSTLHRQSMTNVGKRHNSRHSP